MSHDFKLAQNFRSSTLTIVRQSLGFAVDEENIVADIPESNPVITSFRIVGQALMSSYNIGRS